MTVRADRRRVARSAAHVAASLLVASAASAQGVGAKDCSEWVAKKGYSVDYIQLKTGKRQRGLADSWRGNVEPKDVQPGDVVMTPIRDKGKRLHTSYVEDVRRGDNGSPVAVVVSDWNRLGKYVDEACLVTDHYGREAPPRTIGIESVVRVWRPSLPLPKAPPE
jgi:hypothetical protein